MDTANQDVHTDVSECEEQSQFEDAEESVMESPPTALTSSHGIEAMESTSTHGNELAVGLQSGSVAKSPSTHPLGFHLTHNRVLEKGQSQLLPLLTPLPHPTFRTECHLHYGWRHPSRGGSSDVWQWGSGKYPCPGGRPLNETWFWSSLGYTHMEAYSTWTICWPVGL